MVRSRSPDGEELARYGWHPTPRRQALAGRLPWLPVNRGAVAGQTTKQRNLAGSAWPGGPWWRARFVCGVTVPVRGGAQPHPDCHRLQQRGWVGPIDCIATPLEEKDCISTPPPLHLGDSGH